jgi:hypothetical protein
MAAPLFPWLREAFSLSYAELGLLMTVFFVVRNRPGAWRVSWSTDSVRCRCCWGPSACSWRRPLGFASSTHYAMLLASSALAGLGNAPLPPDRLFHPQCRRWRRNGWVRPTRCMASRAASGWATAPLLLVGVATLAGWRAAFFAAVILAALVLAVVWWHRDLLRMSVKVGGSHGPRRLQAAFRSAGRIERAAPSRSCACPPCG